MCPLQGSSHGGVTYLLDIADGTEMARLLKATTGKSLAEAGRSRSFAIGMSLNNKDLFNRKKWATNGNILGRALMEVRNELND